VERKRYFSDEEVREDDRIDAEYGQSGKKPERQKQPFLFEICQGNEGYDQRGKDIAERHRHQERHEAQPQDDDADEARGYLSGLAPSWLDHFLDQFQNSDDAGHYHVKLAVG
jgi:hypothetical protein